MVALTVARASSEYLKSLGASEIITRDKMIEGDIKLLDSERWMACIDAVGGEILARVLAQIKFGGIAVSVGNAAGNNLPTSVIPFILRGVSLVGMNSATCSYGRKRLRLGLICPMTSKENTYKRPPKQPVWRMYLLLDTIYLPVK